MWLQARDAHRQVRQDRIAVFFILSMNMGIKVVLHLQIVRDPFRLILAGCSEARMYSAT